MRLNIKEVCIFGMFGILMYVSKIAMAMLPNIHLLAFFIITFTVVYQIKALYVLYTYVFIEGLFSGFTMWWIPYLYIWTVLWFVVYMITRHRKNCLNWYWCSVIGFSHGMLFGTLYAPLQMIMFNLSFEQTIAWVIVGLPWDLTHGISNCIMCSFVPIFVKLLKKLEKEKWRL